MDVQRSTWRLPWDIRKWSEILLDAGADPALGDNTWNNPQTPADFARKFGHLAVAQVLEAAAARES